MRSLSGRARRNLRSRNGALRSSSAPVCFSAETAASRSPNNGSRPGWPRFSSRRCRSTSRSSPGSLGSAPRPRPLVLLGLAGGFVGVGILVGPAFSAPPAGGSHHAGLGMLILLFGSLLWSIGSLYSRRARNCRFALSFLRPNDALRRRAHDHRRPRPRRSARLSISAR